VTGHMCDIGALPFERLRVWMILPAIIRCWFVWLLLQACTVSVDVTS